MKCTCTYVTCVLYTYHWTRTVQVKEKESKEFTWKWVIAFSVPKHRVPKPSFTAYKQIPSSSSYKLRDQLACLFRDQYPNYPNQIQNTRPQVVAPHHKGLRLFGTHHFRILLHPIMQLHVHEHGITALLESQCKKFVMRHCIL